MFSFSTPSYRFGILRDNIKDSVSSQDELIQISKAIEKKLYQTAPSPQEYRSMGTIELRIKAYATALLLIHSDGILASQCRNSLPLCAMALVRYEKQNLKTNSQPPRKATPDLNVRSIPQQTQQHNGYQNNMQSTSSKMMLTEEETRAATAAKYFLSQMDNARAISGHKKQKAVQQEGVGYRHRTTIMQQAIMSDSRFRSPFPPSA